MALFFEGTPFHVALKGKRKDNCKLCGPSYVERHTSGQMAIVHKPDQKESLEIATSAMIGE